MFDGRADEPARWLNLVADMGGGGMLLAFGMLCVLVERQRSCEGQIVDAAMVDGAALLATSVYAQRGSGAWSDRRGANLLGTGAHFYEGYETKDGGFIGSGALEPQFYAALFRGMALAQEGFAGQM